MGFSGTSVEEILSSDSTMYCCFAVAICVEGGEIVDGHSIVTRLFLFVVVFVV